MHVKHRSDVPMQVTHVPPHGEQVPSVVKKNDGLHVMHTLLLHELHGSSPEHRVHSLVLVL